MYCRKCGRLNDDNFYKCLGCGEVLPREGGEERPQYPAGSVRVPDYSSFAVGIGIASLFFCCFFSFVGAPFALIAYSFAAKAKKLTLAGDVEGALRASKTALILCLAAIVLMMLAPMLILMTGFGAIQELSQSFSRRHFGI